MSSSLATSRRLLRYSRPYAKGFWVAIAAMMVAAGTEPLFAGLMKPLLDNGFVGKEPFPPWLVPTAIIGIFLVRGISTFASGYALAWVGSRMLVDIRNEMFDRLMRQPAERIDRQAASLMVNRIVFEVIILSDAVTRVLTSLVRDSLVIIGLLGWLIYLNWRLTLVAFLLLPVMAGIVWTFNKRIRRLNARNFQNYGELSRMVEEATLGHKVIKIYDAFRVEAREFAMAAQRLRNLNMRLVIAASATVPITQLCAAVAVSVVISIALLQSQSEQTTVGSFASFITAMLMLMAPLKHLADLNSTVQRALSAAEVVFEMLDAPIEPDTGTRKIGRAVGDLEFQNVSFRYPMAERDALSGISLKIKAGEVVALVGGSGGGKTTLLNLIPRYYNAGSGRILLDGIPIETLTLRSLRAQLAIVSQDVILFNDTIRANVAFGLEGAVDDQRIWAALRDAALDKLVNSLPGGLDAMIGERGATLSGGQRQRLAIARALLKDAPILLLDEATSALDSETEQEVQWALERTMRGRTTFIIAHRLSTIERADRIVVLDAGRIVEEGPHHELQRRDGVYARLHRIQFQQSVDRSSAVDVDAKDHGPG